MGRYHFYKLGIAVLFYAILQRITLFVRCLEIEDPIGNLNDTSRKISAREYFVYYQGVQGRPGVDFPVYTRIPRTTFSCKEVESGYYADLETDCQVFHICNEGSKVSFLCPNGTIFQQADLICDWWFKVNCTNSPNLYEESAEQLRESLIRRKASRRVLGNGNKSGELQNGGSQTKNVNVMMKTRKVPQSHNNQNTQSHPIQENVKINKHHADIGDSTNYNRQGRNRHVSAVDNNNSDEMQITQESASFVSNYNKRVTNTYPNHRATYSEIRDPKTYYTNTPSNHNTLNNGKPFVVSTPKVGSYTTEKSPKYSPTVPSIKKHNYITPLPISTTTKRYMSNYGERIRQANIFANHDLGTNSKIYSNVETFTNPPTVSNGKSTVLRKQNPKQSFTIGLNSVQGTVPFKVVTTSVPFSPKSKSKSVIKLNLSSDEPAKQIPQKTSKPKVHVDSADLTLPKLKLSVENEIPSVTNRPSANGFYVTKNTFQPIPATNDFQAGSITGSQNTYIPTTGQPPITETTTLTYFSNTFGFVKPTGMPKPKPFELPSTTTQSSRTATTEYKDDNTFVPNYQISSASPFTNQPPTLSSLYNTRNFVETPTKSFPISNNAANMLHSLQEIANVRYAKNEDFTQPLENQEEDKRPGLVVPLSVGPQTLHTLAVYFANALDSLVEGNKTTTDEVIATTAQTSVVPADNTVINSLLSADTIDKYQQLFMLMARRGMLKLKETEKLAESEEGPDEQEDLQSEHSNNAVQSPRVRQLAKVFTQALSSYLDDPDSFKKILHQIRPTEPPLLNTVPADAPNDEDELLNFSDADIKPDYPRLPTPAPANPTWGYILAYNTTEFKSNHIDQNEENLQIADSQSFIHGFNEEVNSNRVDKSLKTNSSLPNNHWTSSPDVTKLWQSTLYVNPAHINQNFETTEALLPTSTEETNDFEGDTTDHTASGQDINQDTDLIRHPLDLTPFNRESHIDYELRSIPKFDLNSSSVHGLLIDFMNSSGAQGQGRLERILRKLNTTQEEFLSKMKEIEQNPLTRRLILLLVSECGNLTEAKSNAVRDIINLARQGDVHGRLPPTRKHSDFESLTPQSTQNQLPQRQQEVRSFENLQRNSPPRRENTSLAKLVDSGLSESDQDSRALQLLNSLYNIASKYGK